MSVDPPRTGPAGLPGSCPARTSYVPAGHPAPSRSAPDWWLPTAMVPEVPQVAGARASDDGSRHSARAGRDGDQDRGQFGVDTARPCPQSGKGKLPVQDLADTGRHDYDTAVPVRLGWSPCGLVAHCDTVAAWLARGVPLIACTSPVRSSSEIRT